MSDVVIDVNMPDIRQFTQSLQALGAHMPVALVRASNKTIRGMATDLGRFIRAEYTVKADRIRSTLTPMLSSLGRPGGLKSRGARIGLRRFGGLPFYPIPGNPNHPVSSRVMKGHGRTKFKHHFIARMPDGSNNPQETGNIGFFTRIPGTKMRSKNKEQIQMKYGPSVPEMTHNPNVLSKLNVAVAARMNLNVEREINYARTRIMKAK